MSVMMKTSGIEWIGDIPEYWNIDKLYRLTDLVSSGGTPTSTNPDYYEGDIVWIQTGDLNDGYVTKTSKTITQYGLENSSAKIFEQGTLLMAMYGATIGKLGIMTMNAATNQACCAMKYDVKTDTKFMYYIFLAMRTHLINQSYGGGQPNISQEVIKQQYLCFPKKDEQQIIANFLDHATAKIDYVIKTKQIQLSTLETLKESIIQKAVTKGLDHQVTMKPSGIEWIGDIPEHWKIDRLKDIALINWESLSANTDNDYVLKYLEISNVNSQGIISTDAIEDLTFEEAPSRAKRVIKFGDTIVSSVRPNLQAIAYIEMDQANLICSTGFNTNRVRLPELHDGKFLYYCLLSDYSKQSFVSFGKGVGYPAVDDKDYGTLPIVFPALEEQKDIANFLDQEVQKIYNLKANVQKQIDTLQAYKKSLIYEYVTGKKQVKE